MNGLHVTFSSGAYFTGDLIGFTTGLLITILLLVLTLRAARLPGTPPTNVVFAACALMWTAGGLVHTALEASGANLTGRVALIARAVQFSGAATFPIPILAVWRSFAGSRWQRIAAQIVLAAATLTAAVLAVIVWYAAATAADTGTMDLIHHVAAFSSTWWLIIGGVVSLRRRSAPQAVYLPSLAIVCAVVGSVVTMSLARGPLHHAETGAAMAALASHLVLLIVLCAFFLFARFRYADVFIRYGIRILLAGVWATVLAFFAQSSALMHVARQFPTPATVHIFAVIIVANTLLLSFTFVDERISTLVNRWLFRPPDYRAARRQLAVTLRDLQAESDISKAIETAAQSTLSLAGACLVALEALPASRWPSGTIEGDIVELGSSDLVHAKLPLPNVEVLIPVASEGCVTHVLLVAPGLARPGLITHDLDYLRAIASLCGNRLDALRRERETLEREGRETVLLQQVTEAELRALRAQINPHFLFNSLNTIADLIVRDPPRAEAMTLRLASVFRHVLAHSHRPLTSIGDEIEFLRTYLYIEEVRFGDRLHVEIVVAPEVASEHMPSLILQPLVENALKHGLGPKPGPGNLWISAQPVGCSVRLSVEDDGMGPGLRPQSQGLGLTNVAERLRTMYQDRASVTLEPREGGGSRVTVLIPRGEPLEVEEVAS